MNNLFIKNIYKHINIFLYVSMKNNPNKKKLGVLARKKLKRILMRKN